MLFTSLQTSNRDRRPLSRRQHVAGQIRSYPPVGRLSFSKGRRRYAFEIPSANPADAAEGQPGYRGDAAPRTSIALPHVLDICGPPTAASFAPAEALASGLVPLQPHQCPLPGQAVHRHHLHTVARWESVLQTIQPLPVARGPAAHTLKDLPEFGRAPVSAS